MNDDLPPGYTVVTPAAPPRPPVQALPDLPPGYAVVSAPVVTPTGQAHDGDTFRLSDGRNARLYGADAFELGQTGRTRGGATVPLGINARDFTRPYLTPGASLGFTGTQTYGRPVTSLSNGGSDLAHDLIASGNAWATPEYLRADPARLHDYMEAERQARMNFRGGFATDAPKPSDYRHGTPWASAQALPNGEKGGDVVWWDQPTPFQGLRPEIAQGYTAIFKDMKSKPADLLAYAKANGFQVDPRKVQAAYAHRAKYGNPNDDLSYETSPRVLTDLGDGTTGATVRGFADPFNVLDEAGGLVDAVTPNALRAKGQERENIWSSDRRFGDILANNIEQNRQILDHDTAEHGWARFGGQLAGGLVMPGASVEGVGLGAARSALRSGATRFAAQRAATRAAAIRLGTVGSAEAAAAGFGAGENLSDRVTNAALAAPVGALLGVGTPHAVKGATGLMRRLTGRDAAPGVVDDIATDASRNALEQDVTPSPSRVVDRVSVPADDPALPAGYRVVDREPVPSADADHVAMHAEHRNPALTGPDMGIPAGYRVIDRIEVNDRPRSMLADVSEAQRRAQGQAIRPTDVLPLADSAVADMSEAEAISAGMRPELRAPNEDKALLSRSIASHVDGTKRIAKRGPLDLVTWLRTQGGLKPQGGELDHYGIDNAPRALDFAGGENRFGKLVDPVGGMPYDEAAMRAHEAGFFPDHVDRPDVADFLDAVHATHIGRSRSFRPDDYAEVDQFNADRNARHRIEAARDAGAPMVSDHSQPVDMADLDRNAPPVHAYEEWGDQAPDYAGNLKLDKLDSPQAIKRALTVTEQRVGGFDAATRGRVTQAETANLAGELGMTPQQLLARRKGQAFNAEQALAARQILAKSANELVNMAKRISATNEPGDEAMVAFREAWTRHVAIQEQVAGATAEAGRALSQFRMEASSRAVRGEVLKSLAEGPFGPSRMKDVAKRIVDMEEQGVDPGKVNKFAADATKPRFRDKLVELYYNAILSGPTTHVVNIVSNTMTALGQLPEHAVAAAIGAPRMVAKTANDRVLFAELKARSFGLLQGTQEGFAEAARTMMTGRSSDIGTKVTESASTKAFAGVAGSIIRTPTRALEAEDELFKAMARRMELSGLAVRQANAEGLRGDAASKRVAELIANPTDDLLKKSFDYGRYLTFQQPLAQGSFSAGVSAATQKYPLAKLIIPFVRTPVNILKFSAERSPVAPILKEWRMDVAAGGARRDLAIAKMMVGTGIMAYAVKLAQDGHITGGGPADKDVAATMRANGWQPYSVKIGDKYYAYNRLDPYSTTVGIAADYVELQSHMTETERQNVAGILVASTMKNLADKTWFSGAVDLGQLVGDPLRYGPSYLRNRAVSLVPSFVATAARAIDPGQKEAQGILDAVRARIPFASRSVPNRLDPWGREVTSEGSLGPDFLSPIRVSTARRDLVNDAVIAAGAHVGAPSKKLGDRTLSPDEYRALVVASGKAAHDRIASTIAQPAWQSVPLADRGDALHRIIADTRKQVRAGMFGAPAKKRAPTAGDLPPGFTVVSPSDLPPGYAVVR